jgi:hypothetical protein
MTEMYLGCIDSQTKEQKERNYKLDEVCQSPSVVVWKEKSDWTRYPIRNQHTSCQCVAMTLATEMGIIFKQRYGEFIDFSSSFPYQQRTDKSLMGCKSVDVYSNFPKLGDVFENIMPSQNMTEQQAMAVPLKEYYKDLAKPFRVGRIELPIDFETVASTTQATGKGVMLWFRFSHAEWTDIPRVLPQPTTSGHSVTAVDFLLKNGKKYLVIQDSWGLAYAMNGYRLISEEYFRARCFLASYLKTFEKLDITQATRPKFDGTIISLQKCLKWEGLFPANVQEVENYGNITKQAVIAFQKRYGITPTLGVFGPKTKAKLTGLYN